MRYSEMFGGQYVIRTAKLAQQIDAGEILYVAKVENCELYIRKTHNCAPLPEIYRIPTQGDDGKWYDVTPLVIEANSFIPANPSTAEFVSEVAASYRNFLNLDKVVQPLSLEDAVGKVCLLGKYVKEEGKTIFGRNGYQVIAYDDEGYIIGYEGYCDVVDFDQTRNLTLKVLNLKGTGRAFYPAEVIVDACCKAYEEDCKLAEQYRAALIEKSIVASTESSVHRDFTNNVVELRLKEA